MYTLGCRSCVVQAGGEQVVEAHGQACEREGEMLSLLLLSKVDQQVVAAGEKGNAGHNQRGNRQRVHEPASFAGANPAFPGRARTTVSSIKRGKFGCAELAHTQTPNLLRRYYRSDRVRALYYN